MFSGRSLLSGVLLAMLLFTCLPGCVSPPSMPPQKGPPLDSEEIARRISFFLDQDKAVTSFFSIGDITVSGPEESSDADFLIAGAKNPLRIKMEITHAWGRPLLHILIKDAGVHVVSFTEKRSYRGSMEGIKDSGFLPGLGTDVRRIWGLVRGFPVIVPHERAVSPRGGTIILLGAGGTRRQIIFLHPETGLPGRIKRRGTGVTTRYDDFDQSEAFYYARRIRAVDESSGTSLLLETDKMTVNSPIPEAVFHMETPSDFESVDMDGGDNPGFRPGS